MGKDGSSSERVHKRNSPIHNRESYASPTARTRSVALVAGVAVELQHQNMGWKSITSFSPWSGWIARLLAMYIADDRSFRHCRLRSFVSGQQPTHTLTQACSGGSTVSRASSTLHGTFPGAVRASLTYTRFERARQSLELLRFVVSGKSRSQDKCARFASS